MFDNIIDIPVEKVNLEPLVSCSQTLFIKREDLLHPFVSGNKFRKLKYNLFEAQRINKKTLVTFGGAYSNHIAAVAYAGKQFGFESVGIIRGEELINSFHENPTLKFANSQGMKFEFISRTAYRQRNDPSFIESIEKQFNNAYILPEGGTNELAVKGCEEILNEKDRDFDYVGVSVGTGGTMAGLIRTVLPRQEVIGFSALKGTFQVDILQKFDSGANFELLDSYCFGGYAKIDLQLIRFINEFKEITGIPLDPIYTGKMMYGIIDLLKKGYFSENSRILAVHTGGLQGIEGMNQLLKKKNLPQINL